VSKLRGFTLVELMVCVAIVTVIIAIAIPNLLEARKSSNEVNAIGSLKAIASAQALFRETDKERDGNVDYGTISELGATKVLDAVLATGTKAGYLFETGPGQLTIQHRMLMFYSIANPIILDGTGNRAYASNYQGTIFYTQQALVVSDDLRNVCTIPTDMFPIR
jgi:prepilin-type N-terminal cleavage/methylation domain-containing protein